MSEIELFPEDNTFDNAAPPASPTNVQHTSTPQDTSTEPTAASRGRRPSRTAAAHTSRRRGSPSPSPARCQQPSPASSYASALSSAPAAEKWTVAGLRQALSNAGINAPRRASKADLKVLYASLQAGAPPPIYTPSKAKDKASRGRSAPYSRPDQSTTPSRMSLRSSGRSRRPSASLGRAPDPVTAGSRSLERQPAAPPVDAPARASTSRHGSASTAPPVARPYPQFLSFPTPNPLPYPWPPAPPSSSSARMPPLVARAPTPAIPPLLPNVWFAPVTSASVRPPPLMPQAPTPAIPPLLPNVWPAPRAGQARGRLRLWHRLRRPLFPPFFPPFHLI